MDHSPVRNRTPKVWLFVAEVLVLAVTLSCALVSRSLPQILKQEAPSGLIAYVGTDGNLYTIDREGKQPTAITQDASPDAKEEGFVYQYPTWAPDGRSLAFVGFTSSSSTEPLSILFIAAADGNERTEVFRSQDFFPFYLFWSPDSKYVTTLSNSIIGSYLALHLISPDSGNSRLIGTGQPYYWDWSPDSQAIIMHKGGAAAMNPDAQMMLYKLDEPEQEIELAFKPGFFQSPAWSPDGEQVILVSEEGANGQAVVLTGREGDIRQVLAQVSGPVAFAWSPDGKKLALTTSSADANLQGLFTNLVLMDPDRPVPGQEVVQGVVVAFFWSPDSQKIVYFIPNIENPGDVSQGGSRLGMEAHVYNLATGITRKVAVFEPTDAFLQVLPFFDQYHHSMTIWSPDSTSLVLSTLGQDSVSRIIIIDTDREQSYPIAEGYLASWSWK